MKIDEMYEDILEEGISQDLYHSSEDIKGFLIIEQDKFELSTGMTPREHKPSRGVPFFLSTARTPKNSYNYSLIHSESVVTTFVLDGRKVASNNKIVPVNYFNTNSRKDEFEERILSYSPTLQMSQITKEVHIFLDKSGFRHYSEGLKKIFWILKNKGIPLYIYFESVDYIRLNKKEAKSFLDVLQKYKSNKEDIKKDDWFSSIEKSQRSAYSDNFIVNKNSHVYKQVELITKALVLDKNKLSQEEKQTLFLILNGGDHVIRGVFVASKKNFRGAAKVIALHMKKNNLKSIQDLKDYLNKKFGI